MQFYRGGGFVDRKLAKKGSFYQLRIEEPDVVPLKIMPRCYADKAPTLGLDPRWLVCVDHCGRVWLNEKIEKLEVS